VSETHAHGAQQGRTLNEILGLTVRAAHRETTGDEPTRAWVDNRLYALSDLVPDAHAVSLFLLKPITRSCPADFHTLALMVRDMLCQGLRLRKRNLYRQDGTRSLPQDIFSDTAHEHPRQPRPAVSSQDDEVGVDFLSDTKYFFGGTSFDQAAFNEHLGIRYRKFVEFLSRFYHELFRMGSNGCFAFDYHGGGRDMQDNQASAVIFGKGAGESEGAIGTTGEIGAMKNRPDV
jgi:hypothetical protein